ncbi:plasmolipin isoform X2 [Macaca fascicularis]|uniref:plasmolipin isoform X2 n=1 Tax=Macaca fascicularis TaxID=9541 RepID=UPI003D15DB99
MAEFPSKVSTRTSSPAQGAGASVSALRPDLGFVRSSLGALMLLQLLHMKLYMVPWPLVLMIFNISATVLYITAFIACSAAVDLTSLRGTRPYNQRAAASFFACLVMIAYGVSAFFSYQAWRGVGSNAATSQMAGGYA